jgi:hypothetical protein
VRGTLWSITDDRAVAQDYDPRGVLGDFGLVGDHHDGATVFVKITEERHHLGGGPRIQVSRGLVGQDERGVGTHRSSDRYPLLLTTGQFIGEVMKTISETHHAERRHRPLSAISRFDARVGHW